MRIINLIEDTAGREGCLYEHGLSFFVETKHHKLLVDTGATDAFLFNAQRLGIDVTQIDTVILSHGHYDHAGGILGFSKINPNAKIYMQRTAVNDYYHKSEKMEKYIGIDKRIQYLPQIVFVDGDMAIDEELFLFSGVSGRKMWPAGNLDLKCKTEHGFIQDRMDHEQYLVISQDGKEILLSGCAHNGILNILERYRELYGTDPDAVLSGFHMMRKSGYTDEDRAVIAATAQELKKTDTKFYTGHCTGREPFEMMHRIMGEQLLFVHSGEEILTKTL